MENKSSNHYNQEYFDWQTSIGQFGGWANLPKFIQFIKPEDTVLDFGCGGGWLMKNIPCKHKLGIEVNPAAAKIARENGIEVYVSVDNIPDDSVDGVISNHALEHTLNPLKELQLLRKKLHKNGIIIFVVPCESIHNEYRQGDINHHLYTWNSMCLGNLFTEAGFKVIESRPFPYSWSPRFAIIAKISGRHIFDFVCWLYSLIRPNYSQVRIIATKE
ncbi:MAG: class I SAM-dependent methyltransferase [Anaerolineaceae bacterium]|nr:class I SAM-dependent methyltransferase [Anaerolineaceae bacterium]